jgi:hypothetical protein
MTRRHEVLALMLATLIVAIVLIATQPRDVFWGPDSGNHFIQTQSILRGHIAIEHRFPIGHHFVDIANKTYSTYSPAFPAAAAPFYAAFGHWGLFVLTILGTLLMIALLPALTTRSILLPGVLLVFGTPVLWYTIVFWEHTLAAGIAVAAFILAERERPLIAGVLAAISTVFREEGYVVIASIVIAMLVTRRRPWSFAAAAIIALVPWWFFNWRLFGNPLGLHAAIYSSIAQGNKLANFYPFLFEFSQNRILCIVTAVLLLACSGVRRPAAALPSAACCRPTAASRGVESGALAPHSRLLFIAATAGFVTLTILLLLSPAPMRETLYTQGLFPAIPFSAAMFLSWREQPRFRVVAVLTGIILTTLIVNQADFGVTWGPRHYFWMFPLIAVMAIESIPASRLIMIAAAVLAICSFAIQFEGIRTLRMKLRFSENLLRAVRTDANRVVVTDVFWIPEDLASAFFEKDIALARNDQEFAALSRGSILYIASRQFRLITNRGFQPVLQRVTSRRRIVGGDPMLDVMLIDLK